MFFYKWKYELFDKHTLTDEIIKEYKNEKAKVSDEIRKEKIEKKKKAGKKIIFGMTVKELCLAVYIPIFWLIIYLGIGNGVANGVVLLNNQWKFSKITEVFYISIVLIGIVWIAKNLMERSDYLEFSMFKINYWELFFEKSSEYILSFLIIFALFFSVIKIFFMKKVDFEFFGIFIDEYIFLILITIIVLSIIIFYLLVEFKVKNKFFECIYFYYIFFVFSVTIFIFIGREYQESMSISILFMVNTMIISGLIQAYVRNSEKYKKMKKIYTTKKQEIVEKIIEKNNLKNIREIVADAEKRLNAFNIIIGVFLTVFITGPLRRVWMNIFLIEKIEKIKQLLFYLIAVVSVI